MTTKLKDPNAVKFYTFDWAPLENGVADASSNYLDRGSSPLETISSHVIEVDPDASPGLSVDSSAEVNSDTGVRVWLSGGVINESYKVICRVTTSTGQIDDKTMTVKIRNQ